MWYVPAGRNFEPPVWPDVVSGMSARFEATVER